VSDLDEAVLARWMQSAIPGFSRLEAVEKFAGGQSNPTYRINTADGNFVLRRKPFGKLLPSAHAVTICSSIVFTSGASVCLCARRQPYATASSTARHRTG
jgi:Phosphotransferase enzyme family